MRYLLIFYATLTLFALVLIRAPMMWGNPEFVAMKAVESGHLLQTGDLVLKLDDPKIAPRDLATGDVIRYDKLRRPPKPEPHVGMVPFSVAITPAAVTESGYTSGLKVAVCGIPARIGDIFCGPGTDRCLAIVYVGKDDLPKLEALPTPAITTHSCE